MHDKEQQHQLDEANSLLDQEALRNKVSMLAGGVAVLILLSLLLFNRYQSKQQIARVLETKNREITHQKDEITDSINYARRIQDSILAPMHVVKQVIPDSFILYLPKDVVSGDFYWVEEENGHRIFAAVDCTGHGVPGALMSVVGFNLLNRAVKEVTGKSTTTHITERIVSEAKALLQHTAWNIADIAYALGFEYATYFNNFFKRLTGTNPKALRMQEV